MSNTTSGPCFSPNTHAFQAHAMLNRSRTIQWMYDRWTVFIYPDAQAECHHQDGSVRHQIQGCLAWRGSVLFQGGGHGLPITSPKVTAYGRGSYRGEHGPETPPHLRDRRSSNGSETSQQRVGHRKPAAPTVGHFLGREGSLFLKRETDEKGVVSFDGIAVVFIQTHVTGHVNRRRAGTWQTRWTLNSQMNRKSWSVGVNKTHHGTRDPGCVMHPAEARCSPSAGGVHTTSDAEGGPRSPVQTKSGQERRR